MFPILSLILVFTSGICICGANPRDTLPRHILPGGLELPPIGLGSFDNFKKTDQQKLTMFLNGLELGYRLIDTAYLYDTERHLGLALKQMIANNSVNRSQVFVITKIWNTFHTREGALDNVRYELQELGLKYSDIGLLHYPTSLVGGKERDYWPLVNNGSIEPLYHEKDQGYLEAYRGLEAAERLGLIRQIGISNFNLHQVQIMLEKAIIKPSVLQVECHPLYQNTELTEWARDHNLTVICYSPLREGTPELYNNEVLKEVADRVQRTVRQVALRWNIQRGNIVIPRAYDRNHQIENLDSLNFELDNEDMIKINSIQGIQKVIYPGHVISETIKTHPDYPWD